MKTARLSAPAATTKAAATLKFQAWVRLRASLILLAATFMFGMANAAFGNVFVANGGDPFDVDDILKIGEYTNSGAPINPTLLTRLGATSIAISDGFLYVTDGGTVGKYTTAGATVNASLITGLKNATDIEVSGGDLYVVEYAGDRVGKYTTEGATVNASLISGISLPDGLAISGTRLFVGVGEGISEYTTSGVMVNASLVGELETVHDIEVSGSTLFVARGFGDGGIVGKYNLDGTTINFNLLGEQDSADDLAISGLDLYLIAGDMVGKYTTSGMVVANPLITGLTFPTAIAVDDSATVPETLSTLWFGLAIAGLLAFARKRQPWNRRLASVNLLASALIFGAMPESVLGNLFVTDPSNNGTIGEYTNSGATVNVSLIAGLSDPESIAVSGGFLYVTNPSAGTVGKYTTSGETINASLISGLNGPEDIEVSGGNLYVAEHGNGRIGKYTTSGATVNASLITGLTPDWLAVSGTSLFVADSFVGSIGEYTTSGATVNASLVTDFQNISGAISDVEVSGSSLFISYSIVDDFAVAKYNVDGTAIDPLLIFPLSSANGLAISGTDLFLVEDSTVGKYTTSGMLVADPLITGFGFPSGIAVEDQATVPETLSTLWFGLTTAGLLGFARLLRHKYPLCRSR